MNTQLEFDNIFNYFCSKRELSRLVIIPTTEEASVNKSKEIDEAMEEAGRSIGQLVALKAAIEDEGTKRVEDLEGKINDVLPDMDQKSRVAKNYAILLYFVELVTCLNILCSYNLE